MWIISDNIDRMIMIMPMIIMLRKGKQGVSAFEVTTNAENDKTLR